MAELSLDEVLRRTSLELDQLSQEALIFEKSISGVLAQSAETNVRKDIQSFDLLVQTLSSLSGFYEELSHQVTAHPLVDVASAAQSIPLQAVAERLVRGRGVCAGSTEVTDPEIF